MRPELCLVTCCVSARRRACEGRGSGKRQPPEDPVKPGGCGGSGAPAGSWEPLPVLCVRARRVTLLPCGQGWQGPTLLPARPPGAPVFSIARPPEGGPWGQRFPSAPSWDFFSGSHGPRGDTETHGSQRRRPRREPLRPWSWSPAGPLPSTADVPPAPPALAAASCGPCAASVVPPGACGRPFPSVWPPVRPLLGWGAWVEFAPWGQAPSALRVSASAQGRSPRGLRAHRPVLGFVLSLNWNQS